MAHISEQSHLAQRKNHGKTLEQVAWRFYKRFKDERHAFLAHLSGSSDSESEHFVSLLFDRLMFLYFLQQKGFLDHDRGYLSRHLYRAGERAEEDSFYEQFLWPLFHEGLGTATRQAQFGTIPYLGKSLFSHNEIEASSPDLRIADAAFRRLFAFFDEYHWNLHDQLPQCANEITPGVLGYILEQQANRQHMGAYYTKDDVTGYIARSSLIPALFDAVAQLYPAAFRAEAPLWQALCHSPERYIYQPVRSEMAHPGESTREYATRRAHYTELRSQLLAGQIHDIDDLITYNLDLSRFAEDVIYAIKEPELLLAFYHCLQQLTILDPTCGSGAFLVAALHTLEPLYAASLARMQAFSIANDPSSAFAAVLQEAHSHPSQSYFIRKTIIARNLYGVDLMEEAISNCQLRLSLALIAPVERVEDIEPLPELSNNVRQGNTLVGMPYPAATVEESTSKPFHWPLEFASIFQRGGFSVIIGNPPYVEYTPPVFPYTLPAYATLACANLYPCVVERCHQLLAPHGRHGMILPLAAFTTRNMRPLQDGFRRWFPVSWLSFYHFRPSMLFSGSKAAHIPTAIYLAKASGVEKRFSTSLNKWPTEQRERLFSQLTYCQVTVPEDPENRHYYPKFGRPLENTILRKVLRHTCIKHYLSPRPSQNTMFYRSAGGLYWKVFVNFPWPYQTTSNKQCSFQVGYDRDIFVALLNSSLFWWYYTVTFDSFNLKDYMLFGFRFFYPEDPQVLAALRQLCQQLMESFQSNARHLKRGQTGSYTIYAKKSKAIIDQIDRVLAAHYGLTDEERDFIIDYDMKYRMGQEAASEFVSARL